jgi:hypothetical protein
MSSSGQDPKRKLSKSAVIRNLLFATVLVSGVGCANNMRAPMHDVAEYVADILEVLTAQKAP